MKEDYSAEVEFRNSDMELMGKKLYGLQEYCFGLKDRMMRTIMEIEDVFYGIEDYKHKEDWDEEHKIRFQHLRHAILDVANSVNRIPQNLCYKGKNVNTMTVGEFIKTLVDS